MAFNDLNGNQLYDNGEPGLAGARLLLVRGTAQAYSATSQANGAYSFESISPGQYTFLEEAPPSGFFSNPNMVTLLVNAGNAWTIYMPYDALPTATPTRTASPTPTTTLTPNASEGYLPMILVRTSN